MGGATGEPSGGQGRDWRGEQDLRFPFSLSCLKLLRLVETFPFSFSFQKDGERRRLARVASMRSGKGFKGEDVDWR